MHLLFTFHLLVLNFLTFALFQRRKMKDIAPIIIREAWNIFFDDSSEDELEDVHNKIPRNENYAEEIVPKFSDRIFKNHFRMSPTIFEILCGELHSISSAEHGPGRESIPIQKEMMVTLWYLGNQECLRSIADTFGIAIATAWRVIGRSCESLIKLNHLKKYIKWPTAKEAAQTAQYYQRKRRLQGVIGSIDGTYIHIRAPVKSANSYINRKKFHSVNLQGVCNEKKEFLFCYTGEVGSIQDALLMSRSGLENKITSGHFCINENQHLLGDSAYPLKEWLITPYKDFGNLSPQERIFNTVHSKCRVHIEQSFGLLKGRFRRLFYIDSTKPDKIVKFIIASCILHNVCLINNDFIEEEYPTDEPDDMLEDNTDTFPHIPLAQSKRTNLLNNLF